MQTAANLVGEAVVQYTVWLLSSRGIPCMFNIPLFIPRPRSWSCFHKSGRSLDRSRNIWQMPTRERLITMFESCFCCLLIRFVNSLRIESSVLTVALTSPIIPIRYSSLRLSVNARTYKMVNFQDTSVTFIKAGTLDAEIRNVSGPVAKQNVTDWHLLQTLKPEFEVSITDCALGRELTETGSLQAYTDFRLPYINTTYGEQYKRGKNWF